MMIANSPSFKVLVYQVRMCNVLEFKQSNVEFELVCIKSIVVCLQHSESEMLNINDHFSTVLMMGIHAWPAAATLNRPAALWSKG